MNNFDAETIRICWENGTDLVPYGNYDYGFVVTGFGAGIVMAFADYLILYADYPKIPLLVGEMPGMSGFEKRVTIMNCLSQSFPTVYLLWASVMGGHEKYIDALEQLDWRPQVAWVYLKGLGVTEEVVKRWEKTGAKVIEDLWIPRPLGNLSPSQIEYPSELLMPECSRAEHCRGESSQHSANAL